MSEVASFSPEKQQNVLPQGVFSTNLHLEKKNTLAEKDPVSEEQEDVLPVYHSSS